MQIFTTTEQLRSAIAQQRQQGSSIALTATMGNLHAGHLSLVTTAKEDQHWVVASIFVNPIQFGAGEDLDSYPRTLEEDKQLLESADCDALFLPSVEEMYPSGMSDITSVITPMITERLCGASRPGHFNGVTTVVSKLFNLVGPDCAYFGEKDFQQLATIRKMTQDLNFPINIIGVPIVRASDDLALSSRNGYLSARDRALAPQIQRILQSCKQAIKNASDDHRTLEEKYIKSLNNKGFKVDYFEICNPKTLLPSTSSDVNLVVLVAASLGNTRLIDNVTLSLN